MRLKDMKISNQLKIGLGLITSFVVILGVMAWVESESLWKNTAGLYNHPLKVRGAVGEIKSDVIAIHRDMKDLFLTTDERERQSIIASIDTYEADAYRQFNILYSQYLGPRIDIEEAHNLLVQWKTIRDETIRLLREGKVAEAAGRTRLTGSGAIHAERLIGQIRKISDFAEKKGDQFYRDAEIDKDELMLRLKIVLAVIFFLSLGVGYVLYKAIRYPLAELTSVTEQYREGNFDVRSQYRANNEFGLLAASFNSLADTIESQIRSKEKVARIADVMLREEELRRFSRELLNTLLQNTGSQVGALYLLNDSRTHFEHFESIGLKAENRAPFSADGREGEFGAAVVTGQIQRVKDIPEDSRFSFVAVSGEIKPREILTIPILSGRDVVAIISLASLRGYDDDTIRLINDVTSVLTARMNGVLAYEKIREFSGKLEIQNRELESQKTELKLQANELSEQNVELEAQKRQLDQANQLKSTFLSNMSHELRTPLNSVIALSGVLNRRLRGAIPEEEYGYLEVIERNGKNLLALINDILDLSRIEAGREDIILSSFSVRQLAQEIVEMIRPQADEKNIALVSLLDGDIPGITSDISKCRHILQNLVGNAVKFTEKGRVEISASYDQGAIYISVADTGIGIPAEHFVYIFDEFRQAEEGSSRKYGGSGLGLAIARKYATMLGGKITVESIHGKGSKFTLKLPAKFYGSENAAQFQMPASNPGLDHQGEGYFSPVDKGKTVLLVEDSEPAIVQITDILKEQGVEVQVARNGREALDQIEKEIPAGIILDLMMPEVDGFEVLATIRGKSETARLPVLILSAKHVTKDELAFIRGNNVFQLIQKGDVNKRELIAAVISMVSQGCEST